MLSCLNLTKGVQMTRTECEELCTTGNERNIGVFTDYHEVENSGESFTIRLLTTAELRKEGIRFRKEPDGDDHDHDDHDDDDDFEDDEKGGG